jgi:hypothetical protein
VTLEKNINSPLQGERKLTEWILFLIQSDFEWIGRFLFRGLRYAWRGRPAPIEHRSKAALPTGPFKEKRVREKGDLLLWIPLHIESFIIDDLTGGFGYSHASVDTGEVDLPTGKSVMAEVTMGEKVQLKFQDEYGDRPFARIPLSKTGINAEDFVSCVKSKLGEPYNVLEALTMGKIDDPAKQVCSSLASECLPATVQRDIAKAYKLWLLRRNSVSNHSSPEAPEPKIFISPNGFAQYYGAPRGRNLPGPDCRVDAHTMDVSKKTIARKHGWKAALVLFGISIFSAGTILLFLKHRKRSNPGWNSK